MAGRRRAGRRGGRGRRESRGRRWWRPPSGTPPARKPPPGSRPGTPTTPPAPPPRPPAGETPPPARRYAGFTPSRAGEQDRDGGGGGGGGGGNCDGGACGALGVSGRAASSWREPLLPSPPCHIALAPLQTPSLDSAKTAVPRPPPRLVLVPRHGSSPARRRGSSPASGACPPFLRRLAWKRAAWSRSRRASLSRADARSGVPPSSRSRSCGGG